VQVDYLSQLNDAVTQLIERPTIQSLIDALKQELRNSCEPFVWSAIELQSISARLPEKIKSSWVFVLKKDVPSGCHYHPNSIQHMVMIEGEGTSRVGAIESQMKSFGESGCSLGDFWYVIPEGVPHEFFPKRSDMVVVSFHTCASDELEEISCDSGAARIYKSHS
jgi:hypothetical protein